MAASSSRIEALLRPLVDFERQRPDRVRWGLDTMRRLLARPCAPRPGTAKLLQIGGSKGKGTTAAYVEALARAAGLRVGVYSSPHVSSVLERVRIDGADVREDLLAEQLQPVLDFAARERIRVSYFEALTAAAVACFAAREVDLGVLEVGLGGRLDATTAVDVDASVITGVELEHTEILGDTVEAIAAEKAGILRTGRPGFVALDGPALAIAAERAREVGCDLQVLGRDFGYELRVASGDERRLALWCGLGASRAAGELRVRGAPAHEDAAAALAWVFLRHFWPDRLDPDLTVPRPSLPGRFEVVQWGRQTFVLDGAHTARSAELLAQAVRDRFPGRRFGVLFGTARGKRWRDVLRPLSPIADRFVVTGVSGTDSEDPAAIGSWLAQCGARVGAVPDAAAGLRELRTWGGPVLVTGSFYLVGEVRGRVRELDE